MKAGTFGTQGNPFLVSEILGFSKPQLQGELGDGGGVGQRMREGGREREQERVSTQLCNGNLAPSLHSLSFLSMWLKSQVENFFPF